MKFCKSLFNIVALLIPVALIHGWHQLKDKAVILPILSALFVALFIEAVLSLGRDALRRVNFCKAGAKCSAQKTKHILTAINSPCYYLIMVCSRKLVIGILLLLAAWLNIYVLSWLLLLIPMEILHRKLLKRELAARSRFVHEKYGGWQEALAAGEQAGCMLAEDTESYQSPVRLPFGGAFKAFRQVRTGTKAAQAANAAIRLASAATAGYDLMLKDFNPLFFMLYAVLLALFFSYLNLAVNGSLSKGDLMNSILYIEEVEDRLRAKG